MSLQPNIGGIHRALYVLVGAGMMAWGFSVADAPWAKVVLPILGAGALIEGLIAF